MIKLFYILALSLVSCINVYFCIGVTEKIVKKTIVVPGASEDYGDPNETIRNFDSLSEEVQDNWNNIHTEYTKSRFRAEVLGQAAAILAEDGKRNIALEESAQIYLNLLETTSQKRKAFLDKYGRKK